MLTSEDFFLNGMYYTFSLEFLFPFNTKSYSYSMSVFNVFHRQEC